MIPAQVTLKHTVDNTVEHTARPSGPGLAERTGDRRPQPDGLRSRKKARTRRAIEEAALSLFEREGFESTTVEQIAASADVSATTFFRYFPTKAEVLLSDHGQHLPALSAAILDRPAHETELVAVRRAVLDVWVVAIDPERTARTARIVSASPLLQGLSYQRGFRWLEVIADTLAQRRGLREPDDVCSMAARVTLAVLASAVEGWLATNCRHSLVEAVEHGFDLMARLCSEWTVPEPDSETGLA